MPPPPRVFLQKSAQTVENKGSEREKERQESSRARKLLRRKSLRMGRRNLVGFQEAGAETRLLEGRGMDDTGTRQQNLDQEITASVTICQVRN
jgi:hypothetical protein